MSGYAFNPFTGNFDVVGLTFPDLASPPGGTALGSSGSPFTEIWGSVGLLAGQAETIDPFEYNFPSGSAVWPTLTAFNTDGPSFFNDGTTAFLQGGLIVTTVSPAMDWGTATHLILVGLETDLFTTSDNVTAIYNLDGTQTTVNHNGSGAFHKVRGNNLSVYNAQASGSGVTGIDISSASDGPVTDIRGIFAAVFAGNTTTNLVSLHAQATVTAGSTTNAIGLLIDDISGASNNFSIKTGIAPSLFGGTVTATDFIPTTARAANLVYAGPASGSAAVPTWRALVSGDVSGLITTISGNAGTATALQTARAINGVSFDGTAAITVTAAAGTLSGATLAAGVTASSLTSVGTIATGVWSGTAIAVAKGGTGSAFFTVAGPSTTRTYTFPDAAATIARTDAAQTFTGDQTFSGNIVSNGSAISNAFTGGSGRWGIGTSSNQYAMFLNYAGNVVSLGQTQKFGWENNGSAGGGTLDTILLRAAAATIQAGADVNGAAIAQTIQAANAITGTNVAGASLTARPGVGTGTGTISSFIVQSPTLGTTGTTAQTQATRLTVNQGGVKCSAPLWLDNAAVTGLTPGALAALTTATIVIYDSTGQAYRVPCVI